MKNIMATIVYTNMIAEDLHYRAKGESFYGLHLLADRIRGGLKDANDGLKENFYMGELQIIPPSPVEIHEAANALYENELRLVPLSDGDADNKTLLVRMRDALHYLAALIEEFKSDNATLQSGTTAIIDNVAQHAINSLALVNRSLA